MQDRYQQKEHNEEKCADFLARPRPPDSRQLLMSHAEALREEAHHLETLARGLPPLPPEANRVLYELVDIHRRPLTR